MLNLRAHASPGNNGTLAVSASVLSWSEKPTREKRTSGETTEKRKGERECEQER